MSWDRQPLLRSYIIATIKTSITGLEGNKILQHGYCWGTNTNPTIEDEHTTLGSIINSGDFTSDIGDLQSGVKYYIKSYITYPGGTVYGGQINFQTIPLSLPMVSADSVGSIKYNQVTIYGLLSDDGGTIVSERGFCWNKTGNPTLQNNLDLSSEGTGIGSFLSTVTNLEEITEYFFVAYATNETGTSYSEISSFTTLDLTTPIVSTSNISYLTPTTAQSGGNVTNNGNGTIISHGICWTTIGIPTLEDNIGYSIASGDVNGYQWRKDGSDISEGGNISGSTTNELIITNVSEIDAGIYDCMVSGECNTELSEPASLILTGITTLKSGNIEIFPNPTSGIFKIHCTNNKRIIKVLIIDQWGNQVLSRIVNRFEDQIDLSDCEKGIYLIKVQTNNDIYYSKILLQ